jgi:hypothetical protein
MGIRSFGRGFVALGLGSLLLVASVAPAAATMYSRESYAGTDAGQYECGTGNWVDVEVSFSGVDSIRTGTGEYAGAFFDHNVYEVREVHTNRLTGEYLVITANGNFKETKATHVSGSIFEFSSVQSGQPFVVTDSSGQVLVRDRGTIRSTILFDTLGDATPGGIWLADVSFFVAGPHPGLDFDTCSVLG